MGRADCVLHESNQLCADGMIIIWAPSNTPVTSTYAYGSDASVEDILVDKEHWKPRTTFR